MVIAPFIQKINLESKHGYTCHVATHDSFEFESGYIQPNTSTSEAVLVVVLSKMREASSDQRWRHQFFVLETNMAWSFGADKYIQYVCSYDYDESHIGKGVTVFHVYRYSTLEET